MLIATALSCLALNVFHESRGEPLMGQYAVALVTVNRARRDEEQVCEETFKSKQFSWTSQVRKVKGGWVIPQHLYPKVENKLEEKAWWRAVAVTRKVLAGRVSDFTQGSKNYHAMSVSPNWGLKPVFDIGRHRFYLPKKISQS